MPSVTFIHPDGREATAPAAIGASVMQVAVAQGYAGIVAECGGALSCATCHVYVDPAFLPLLPAVSDTEDQMLDFTAAPREPTSRLACQVIMTEALDGLVVRIADPQL